MKNILSLILVFLFFGCQEESKQTFETKDSFRASVSKNIRVGKGKYKTISSVYPIAPGTTVTISPGIYNEQLKLSSDVSFILEPGAVIDYFDVAVINEGRVKNCSITGGSIIGGGTVVRLTDTSELTMTGVTVKDNFISSYGVIQVKYGVLNFTGNMSTLGPCITFINGKLKATGNFYSEWDYTIWIQGRYINNSDTAIVRGNIECNYNSALAIYGGYLDFEGTALSHKWFGFEMGGGRALLKNSTFESRSPEGYQTGDAINKYGGLDLTLDNCKMICLAPAYSISEEGRYDSVKLLSDCYANQPKSPKITLTGTGKLILQ